MELRCFSCGKSMELEGRPGRGDRCSGCGAYLRVCLNCRFHDESAYNECLEPMAERELYKERATFCDYFDFKEGDDSKGRGEKEESLRKLKELFGDH